MAFINVAEWSPHSVVNWLQGLEDSILPYVPFFLNNNINGCRLLLLSCDDLENLNVTKIGHQEIILDAVDLLKHLHYNFCTETLQTLALKLGCKARSLFNHLKVEEADASNDEKNKSSEKVSTKTLSGVCDIMSSVKSFISWIDRYPFNGSSDYVTIRKTILKLSIELASTAQRDQFVEYPNEVIRRNCAIFAEICDRIVQELNDSLAIQPAWLDVVTIKKKKDEELGLHIHSSYSGIHIVGGIKFQSAAHICKYIEEGDEIVQINYQTVVGWQLTKLVNAMKEFPTELTLTLKKRPRHSNGQLTLIKPYKIPSVKPKSQGKYLKSPSSTSSSTENNQICVNSTTVSNPCGNNSDTESEQIDKASKQCQGTGPIYQLLPRRPRITVKRRATISGSSSTSPFPSIRIEDIVDRKDFISRSISQDDSKDPSRSKSQCKSDGHRSSLSEVPSQSTLSRTMNNKPNPTQKSSSTSQVPYSKPASLIFSSPSQDNASKSSTKPKQRADIRHNEMEKVRSPDIPKSSESGCRFSDNLNENLLNSATPSTGIGYEAPFVSSERRLDEIRLVSKPVHANNGGNFDGSTIANLSSEPNLKSQEIRKSKPAVPRKSIKVQQLKATRETPCHEIQTPDYKGWLYKKKDYQSYNSTGTCWLRRWAVLKRDYLYCYLNPEATKAQCLIHLPAFKVTSITPDLNSTHKFAFKLSNLRTVFHFAIDSELESNQWLKRLSACITSYKCSDNSGERQKEKSCFSESDESEVESGTINRSLSRLSSGCGGVEGRLRDAVETSSNIDKNSSACMNSRVKRTPSSSVSSIVSEERIRKGSINNSDTYSQFDCDKSSTCSELDICTPSSCSSSVFFSNEYEVKPSLSSLSNSDRLKTKMESFKQKESANMEFKVSRKSSMTSFPSSNNKPTVVGVSFGRSQSCLDQSSITAAIRSRRFDTFTGHSYAQLTFSRPPLSRKTKTSVSSSSSSPILPSKSLKGKFVNMAQIQPPALPPKPEVSGGVGIGEVAGKRVPREEKFLTRCPFSTSTSPVTPVTPVTPSYWFNVDAKDVREDKVDKCEKVSLDHHQRNGVTRDIPKPRPRISKLKERGHKLSSSSLSQESETCQETSNCESGPLSVPYQVNERPSKAVSNPLYVRMSATSSGLTDAKSCTISSNNNNNNKSDELSSVHDNSSKHDHEQFVPTSPSDEDEIDHRKSDIYESVLDKEYNRLYGDKSPNSSVISNSSSGSNNKPNLLPRTATSEEIVNLYTHSRPLLHSSVESDYAYNSEGSIPIFQHLKRSISSSKLDRSCNSPISDNSLSSSSGISSYYSSNMNNNSSDRINPANASSPSSNPKHQHDSQNNSSTGSISGYGSLMSQSMYDDCLNSGCNDNSTSTSPSHHHTSSLNNGKYSPSYEQSCEDVPIKETATKSAFRLFSSPKLLKKFTTPKHQKERNSEKQKSAPRIQDNSLVNLPPTPSNKRSPFTFYSPKLKRAFFAPSSPVSSLPVPANSKPVAIISSTQSVLHRSASAQTPERHLGQFDRSSSESSLSSSLSGYCRIGRGKPKVTEKKEGRKPGLKITIPPNNCDLYSAESSDCPLTPGTPRLNKPTMGIAMIGKRKPSIVSTDKTAIEIALASVRSNNNELKKESYENLCNQTSNQCTDDPSFIEDEWFSIGRIMKEAGYSSDSQNGKDQNQGPGKAKTVNIKSAKLKALSEDVICKVVLNLKDLQRKLKNDNLLSESQEVEKLLELPLKLNELEKWFEKYPQLVP